MTSQKDTRTEPQYKLRMPAELKEQLTLQAEKNKRSLNAEIVDRLQKSVKLEDDFVATFDFVGELDSRLGEIEKNMSKVLKHLGYED